ncbi:hypothetical protein [Sinomonas sp. P47F7]|uniref:hypothetical protein n=1 Tax=Sinomonas sp. P47F7 TaxID=3410987 RepID=UPI003BF5F5D5
MLDRRRRVAEGTGTFRIKGLSMTGTVEAQHDNALLMLSVTNNTTMSVFIKSQSTIMQHQHLTYGPCMIGAVEDRTWYLRDEPRDIPPVERWGTLGPFSIPFTGFSRNLQSWIEVTASTKPPLADWIKKPTVFNVTWPEVKAK